jgi:hypothetical protein
MQEDKIKDACLLTSPAKPVLTGASQAGKIKIDGIFVKF